MTMCDVLYVATVSSPGSPFISNSGSWQLAVLVTTTEIGGGIVQVCPCMIRLAIAQHPTHYHAVVLRPPSAGSVKWITSSRDNRDRRRHSMWLHSYCSGSLHAGATRSFRHGTRMARDRSRLFGRIQ